MKILLFALMIMLMIISGCSSNKKENKALQESLDRPEEAAPVVQVDGDAKVLEKFEVEEIEEKVIVVPSKKVAKEKGISPRKAKPKLIVLTPKMKPDLPVAVVPAPVKSNLPEDYPPEMLALNEKSQKVWKLYKPNHNVNEKVFLDINYLGMTVGKIMLTNRGKKMINAKEVWHFHARFKSAPFYSRIYELDDTVDTYVTTDQFLSLRYSLIQRESSQDIDDLQLFDREKLQSFWYYKRKKKENGQIKVREEVIPIPYFSVDPFSVVYFYQGLPLKSGDIYEIPIINKEKILLLRSEVEGRETIKTDIGKREAIRVHATTQYTGETLKSGELYFWFSNDEKRTLLKAQAKIKIGSVTADIVKSE